MEQIIHQIGPSLEDILAGNNTPRDWRPSPSLAAAEEHFQNHVRQLLQTNPNEWLLVFESGQYEIFPSNELAESHAESLSLRANQFVIGQIAEYELHDNKF